MVVQQLRAHSLTVLSSLGPGLLPCLLSERVMVPSSPPKPVPASLPAASPEAFEPSFRVAAQHQWAAEGSSIG